MAHVFFPFSDDSCLTPNAQNGICIVYVNCDFILQLLIRNANLRDPAIENYVAQSVCGYSDVTPMVMLAFTTIKDRA